VDLNPGQLDALVAIAEHGSFDAAARVQRTAPPFLLHQAVFGRLHGVSFAQAVHDDLEEARAGMAAIFDEVEDFEANIRNVSGPGNLAVPINGNALDPNHGLLLGPGDNLNVAPNGLNAFMLPTANREQVTVNHEEIKGFMPGMTMPYKVRDAKQLEGVAPGDLVKAKLVVLSNDAYLTDITKVGQAPLPKAPADVPAPSASSGFELGLWCQRRRDEISRGCCRQARRKH